MSFSDELNLESLVLRGRDKFSLIRVNVEVLACVDESKVFGSLDNEENGVFNVEDEG